jgi:hypothetical protein
VSELESIVERELERMVRVSAVKPNWADVEQRLARKKGPVRGRLGRSRRLAGAAIALAVGIGVVVWSPWSGQGGFQGRALAALGSGPVLHVVAQVPTGGDGAQLMDLSSGTTEQVPQPQVEMEIWYDRRHGLKHTIQRADGKTTDDILETPEGAYTSRGIVYDCAWIAAHPVEATKARVSCNANGKNGTTPRVIPRPKPSIDPALQGFLDGYQHALATGKAHRSGTGEIDGRPVVWLAFDLPGRGSERVAVDSETLRPLLVRYEPGSHSYRIEQIRTESSEEANFSKPKVTDDGSQPAKGEVIRSKSLPLTPTRMDAALPGAVWAGNPLDGLPLTSARRDELRTSFADRTLPPEPGVGLRLEYGSAAAGSWVVLMESNRPQFGYQWGARVTTPLSRLNGKLYYYPTGAAIGFTVVNGVYTTINAADHHLLIRAARSLRAASGERRVNASPGG